MLHKAAYRVLVVNAHTITIEDLNQGKSVTNDAERVVAELLGQYGASHRIFYYDTMGNHDELCHDGVRFTHFAPARDQALSRTTPP